MKALGKNIRYQLEKNNITQKYLAWKLGVTESTLSRWSNGKRIPSLSNVYAMSKIFGCTMDELMGLPPAERDTAEWIESDGQRILLENSIKKGEVWRICSKCGAGFMIGHKYETDKMYHETFHNFCPKCGRRMVLVQ